MKADSAEPTTIDEKGIRNAGFHGAEAEASGHLGIG